MSAGKSYTCPMHPEVVKKREGMCPICGMVLIPSTVSKQYTCPMHSEVIKNNQGMCPICGMGLIETDSKKHKPESKRDYNKHIDHSQTKFLIWFIVSLILTIPVLIYSKVPQQLLGFTPPAFFGSEYIPFILSTIVFFYGGWVFLIGAWRELRARLPGMMTLIALAITTAFVFSVAVTFFIPGEPLYWELTTLISVMLLGHYIEMKAVRGSQSALRELSKLLPDTAEVMHGESIHVMKVSELKEGFIVLVKPGGRIPTDGVVIEGKSDVDESLISGESKPVGKFEKSEVIAGTINGDGLLKIQITRVGEHTFLAGVMRLVEEAQASKSKLQLLSDKAAYYLTVLAITFGVITLFGWLYVGQSVVFSVSRLVAVLVITCPHALGLAIPLVSSISTSMAAKNGFIIKKRLGLEAARQIDTVLFDKTGTLTEGKYGVEKIFPNSKSEEEVLRLAASVDLGSEHFIAKAIVNSANQKKIKLTEPKSFERIPGIGAKAIINGKEIVIGGISVIDWADSILKPEFEKLTNEESKKGRTVVFVLSGKIILGAISLGDKIRAESREAVNTLKKAGINVVLLTGDSEGVAEWVSKELGIDEYYSRVLPQDKSEKVKMLQSKGRKVAMVGDGINDAPALTQADVGIAIGAGTNVAIESADIILVKNDPRDIPKIIRLSKLTYDKMIQNLVWATGYNVVAIPLAAGVLISYGILLQPAFAAILMSLSTVIVAVNAAMLGRQKL